MSSSRQSHCECGFIRNNALTRVASNFFLFSLLSLHQYAKMSLCMNCKTVHCSHSKLACFSSPSLFLQLFRNAIIFMITFFHPHDVPPVPPAVYYPSSVDVSWSSEAGKVMRKSAAIWNWWKLLGSFFLFVHTNVKFQSRGGRTPLVCSHRKHCGTSSTKQLEGLTLLPK